MWIKLNDDGGTAINLDLIESIRPYDSNSKNAAKPYSVMFYPRLDGFSYEESFATEKARDNYYNALVKRLTEWQR